MKKISVIMSIYKETKEELHDSIYSILNQTYENFEFIIVIDNPMEKWRIDFVNAIGDNRIRLIVNKKNIGLTKSLNIALKHVSGQYVARMDADDISFPNRLEKQLNYLEKNNLDMCGSNIICFYNDVGFKKIHYPKSYFGVKKLIYYENCLAHPTYFLKKEIYDSLGGYHEVPSCEDYDFLLRTFEKKYRIGNVPDILLKYRLRPNSISRSNPGKQVLISNFIRKFYKKHTNQFVTDIMIEKFLLSNSYKKKINQYNHYWNMKNKRIKYQEEKSFQYYFYTMLLVLNLKYFIPILFKRVYKKIIFMREKRTKDL